MVLRLLSEHIILKGYHLHIHFTIQTNPYVLINPNKHDQLHCDLRIHKQFFIMINKTKKLIQHRVFHISLFLMMGPCYIGPKRSYLDVEDNLHPSFTWVRNVDIWMWKIIFINLSHSDTNNKETHSYTNKKETQNQIQL